MKRAKRAQVMALGAVTMLIMALMLMLSLNLTQAVHEKIRLQSHSDAMAYSMATVEARAMNFYAYSNRATAAASVSIMSLHAYHAAMTTTGQTMRAAMIAFIEIVAWELAEFAVGCPFCQWQHLGHAIQAGVIASRFGREWRRYDRAVTQVEPWFNRSVQAYSLLIDGIFLSQQAVTLHTANVLRGNSLDSLHDLNAPCSSQLATGVGLMNVRQFACALEGSPIDFACIGGTAKSPVQARSRVISNVANAARGEFPKSRNIPFPSLLHPRALADLMRQIQGQGFSVPVLTGGSAKVTQGRSIAACESSANSRIGETICGFDTGLVTSFFIDSPPGFMTFDGEVYSDDRGGAHRPGSTHRGTHPEWHGFERTDGVVQCLTRGECFVNFRSNPAANRDFGQPKVYGYFQQSLRENSKCNKGPWELGKDGKLTLGDGDRGDAALDMVPRDPASAVSKAMVYFHRPDDWRMPPTMFDPYWKAKLHPFTNVEAAQILGLGLNATGAGMALGGPVEGRDP
jgi:hypothetical protein